MLLQVFYSFEKPKNLFGNIGSEIINLQNCSLSINSDWYSRENNRRFVLLLRNEEGINNLSSLLLNRLCTTQTIYPKVSEDFFLKSLLDRESPIGWAIYIDTLNNEVTIARDVFGAIPLQYLYIPGQFIAFSNDIPTLLQIPEVKKNLGSIDLRRVSNFLNGHLKADKYYNSSTIYSNIKNVLPGYVTKFNKNNCKAEFYNHTYLDRWKGLNTLEDFGGEFRNILGRSVAREIGNNANISAHLSGGLDSSSVCCLVRQQRPDANLYTFFNKTDTIYTDEKDHALMVSKRCDSTHQIVPSSVNEIDSIIRNTFLTGQPDETMFASSMHDRTISLAARLQSQIFLTGYDGDGIVGYGVEYLTQLYTKSNWSELHNILEDYARSKALLNRGDYVESFELRKQKIFSGHLYKWLVKSIKSNDILKTLQILKAAYSHFDISPYHLLGKGVANFVRKKTNLQPFSLLRNEIIKSTPNIERIPGEKVNFFYQDILFDSSIRMVEQMYLQGCNSNVSIRHPFYNMDLYEFCLSVPPKIKYGKMGLTRAHFREAMKGILPESVRTRMDKATFDIAVRNTAIKQYQQSKDLLSDSSKIWDYVDKKKFHLALHILTNENQKYQNLYYKMGTMVSQTIMFSVWLDYYELSRK
jgi:asparagine synthase (glutamine-hydrolysing)